MVSGYVCMDNVGDVIYLRGAGGAGVSSSGGIARLSSVGVTLAGDGILDHVDNTRHLVGV